MQSQQCILCSSLPDVFPEGDISPQPSKGRLHGVDWDGRTHPAFAGARF